MTKILIIDDDKTMRQVLMNSLSSLCETEFIESEEMKSSVELAQKEKPEIIFIDIQLPEISEVNAVRGAVADLKKASPNSNVVVMEGIGSDETLLESAMKSGASSKISKPFRMEELRKAVEKTIPTTENMQQVKKEAKKAKAPSIGKTSRYSYILIFFTLAVLSSLVFLIKSRLFRDSGASFDFRSKNISYICINSDAVYVSDWMDYGIYVYDKNNFKLIDALNQDKAQPTAVAVDAENFWIADSLQGFFFHFLKSREKKTLPQVTFKKEHKSPGPSPTGVYLDGDIIWSYDIHTKKIYKQKIDNLLVVITSYDIPVENPCGFTKYKKHFYLADSKTNRIFKMSPEDLILEKIYVFPEYEKKDYRLIAFGSDGKHFWSASENGKIYRHPPSALRSIKNISERK